MSQFTPNSASPAPQGFPVPQGRYQAPQAPQTPRKKGSAGVWIAVAIVLAIICGFFLMRALTRSGSSDSTSDPSSSASSSPTPTSSYLDEGITVEITTESRKACYKAVDESGKMDAISIIKTRSVRNQGKPRVGTRNIRTPLPSRELLRAQRLRAPMRSPATLLIPTTRTNILSTEIQASLPTRLHPTDLI